MPVDLTNRVIVITGASSGIGAATARACAAAGMDVVLNARRADRLKDVAADVQQHGRKAVLVVGDVTTPGMSTELLDTAMDKLGRFDVVYANAGYGFRRTAHETSDEEWRKIFDVNFFAATELLSEAASRLITQQRGGHLLMCSSAVAKFTLPSFSAYTATKAAQNHVCRAMRLELRPHRIEVSSVHPITTRTEFFDVAAHHSNLPAPGADAPGWFVQTPERVANAIVKCLRRPKAEVWTAFGPRLLAGVGTTFPRFMDRAMRWLS
jgi:short-subunit dehydrogenase